MSAVIFEEITRFGQVLLMGVMLAGSYDILRIIRAVFVHTRWLEDGEDILFWIIWFVYLVDSLYFGSYGTVRGYIILAFLIGIFLYENICSHCIVKLFSLFLQKVKQILSGIFCKIIHLFKKLTKYKKHNTMKIGRMSGRRGYSHENKKKSRISKKEATK